MSDNFKLQERDLFMLYGLLKYPMSLIQIFQYINLNYYEKPFPSLNYLQERIKILHNQKLIKRDKIETGNSIKPCFYYYLSVNAKRFIPELQDINNKNAILSSIPIFEIEYSLLVSEFMIYFEHSMMKRKMEFQYWLRKGDIIYDIALNGKKQKLVPQGTIIIKDSEGNYHLFYLETNISKNLLFNIEKDYFIDKLALYENILKSKDNSFKGISFKSRSVLCLFNNKEKMRNTIRKTENFTGNYFFLETQNIKNRNLLRNKIWTNKHNEQVKLI